MILNGLLRVMLCHRTVAERQILLQAPTPGRDVCRQSRGSVD